jgi:hypothetical protein
LSSPRSREKRKFWTKICVFLSFFTRIALIPRKCPTVRSSSQLTYTRFGHLKISFSEKFSGVLGLNYGKPPELSKRRKLFLLFNLLLEYLFEVTAKCRLKSLLHSVPASKCGAIPLLSQVFLPICKRLCFDDSKFIDNYPFLAQIGDFSPQKKPSQYNCRRS